MKLALSIPVLLTGCASMPSIMPSSGASVTEIASGVAGSGADPMLSYLGGACTVAGVIAMVITRGGMGGRAIAVGIALILLNHVIARYGHWLFLPAVIATAAVSLTYGYLTIQRMLSHRRGNSPCFLRPSRHSSVPSGSASSSAQSASGQAGTSRHAPAPSARTDQ